MLEQTELPNVQQACRAFGRILVADEESFSQAVAELLRREGYHCDCVSEPDSIRRMMSSAEYDLLITNVTMLGGRKLEIIGNLPQIPESTQVILVTDTPSIPSALMSMRPRPSACLVKPVELEQLLTHVRTAVGQVRLYRSVMDMRQRLLETARDLNDIAELVAVQHGGTSALPIQTFLALAFRNATTSLLDLRQLAEAALTTEDTQAACGMLQCPRLGSLVDLLVETIDVLESTKGSFKSKELGDLRRKLSGIVNSAATGGPETRS